MSKMTSAPILGVKGTPVVDVEWFSEMGHISYRGAGVFTRCV